MIVFTYGPIAPPPPYPLVFTSSVFLGYICICMSYLLTSNTCYLLFAICCLPSETWCLLPVDTCFKHVNPHNKNWFLRLQRLNIFIVQGSAAPKNGVEFCQKTNIAQLHCTTADNVADFLPIRGLEMISDTQHIHTHTQKSGKIPQFSWPPPPGCFALFWIWEKFEIWRPPLGSNLGKI